MPFTLKASKEGLEIIEKARKRKRWSKTEDAWWQSVPTSKSTLKRFWMGKRIQQTFFEGICQVLGVTNWEEIVDKEDISDDKIEANIISERYAENDAKWMLVLTAKFHDLKKQQALAIVEHLKIILEDTSITLIEIREGSVVLVLSGSQETFEWMQYLFNSGDITELLGVPILDVRIAPVNLNEWLQNNFIEAMQAGWQTIEEIFATTTLRPAFRSNAIKRAKEIELSDRILVLVLDLLPAENQEISVVLGIYPVEPQLYLPENLKLTVRESGETLAEISPSTSSQGMVQSLFFLPGEEFSIEIYLNDFSTQETFVISAN